MAIGGPGLTGLHVLIAAPLSERADALGRHLASVSSWVCEQISVSDDLPAALRADAWDAVVLEHDASTLESNERVRTVVAEAGRCPVIVVCEDVPGSEVAALLRSGAAGFAPIERPDEVVIAIDHAVGLVRNSRKHAWRELRTMERSAQEARERFQAAFEHAPVGMTVSTPDGRMLEVNDSMCEITGYTREDLTAMNLATITHPEELEEGIQLHRQLRSGDIDSYIRDGRLLCANGEAVWVSRHVRVLRDEDGEPRQVLTHFVDITERRTMEHELRHMADHDPLTGLLNRRGLEAELERQVTHVNRYGDRGALLVLDVDHLKVVNDSMGHEAGDRLIVNVANVLSRRLRSSDHVARLGGDEFAILLPDANAEVARHVAEQIVTDIYGNPLVDPGHTPKRVTASVGVTMFQQGQLNPEGVLVDADLAMYDAKEAGRNQVAMHSSEQPDQPRMKARLEWIDRIRSALDYGHFTLHAQRTVELHTGHVNQCELLLRMVGESGDTIPPGAFLYIAERYDLIQELDEWVARRAIELVAREEAAGREGLVEINVSAKSLANEGLLDVIEDEIARYGVNPERLVFEVSETAAISHLTLARTFAERLQRIGCASRSTTSAPVRRLLLPQAHPLRLPQDRPRVHHRLPPEPDRSAGDGRSSRSPTASTSRRSPRASRTTRPSSSCAGAASTSRRATTSVARFRSRTTPRSGSPEPGSGGQAVGVGVVHGLRTVARVDLREQVVDVALDGRLADEQLGRDLAIRATLRDQREHLGLTRREVIRQRCRRSRLTACFRTLGRRALSRRRGNQLLVNDRIEQRLMRGRCLNRTGDLGDAGVLGQVAARTGAESVEDRRLIRVRGQHNDLGLGVVVADPPRGLHPIHLRHAQIHEHDVRAVLGARATASSPSRAAATGSRPSAASSNVVSPSRTSP